MWYVKKGKKMESSKVLNKNHKRQKQSGEQNKGEKKGQWIENNNKYGNQYGMLYQKSPLTSVV